MSRGNTPHFAPDFAAHFAADFAPDFAAHFTVDLGGIKLRPFRPENLENFAIFKIFLRILRISKVRPSPAECLTLTDQKIFFGGKTKLSIFFPQRGRIGSFGSDFLAGRGLGEGVLEG